MKKLIEFEEEKEEIKQLTESVNRLIEREESLLRDIDELSGDGQEADLLLLKVNMLANDCKRLEESLDPDTAYMSAALFTVKQLGSRLDKLKDLLAETSDKLSASELLGDKAKQTQSLKAFMEALKE
ncbi:MAG: hypothetical protein K6F00_10075 [Lachnospiraceae bacterium]|nr:hypothetical protein [Lachnospiraceae bacterium]